MIHFIITSNLYDDLWLTDIIWYIIMPMCSYIMISVYMSVFVCCSNYT